MIDINTHFKHEVICIYKDEQYSVRDNGAVLRHQKVGKRLRPLDNYWTFGKPCLKRGYLYFASKFPIHRIVATAFHGLPPTEEHVVDHIDTNHKNNRPENLRWLTRLENILLNPITVQRIILVCGSIENFLEDPSLLRDSKLDPNFNWMRTVTTIEAEHCKARMLSWIQSDRENSGGSLGEWVFSLPTKHPSEAMTKIPSQVTSRIADINKNKSPSTQELFVCKTGSDKKVFSIDKSYLVDLLPAKTAGAFQRNWYTPNEFPCCPHENEAEPIKAYAEKIVPGAIFSRNKYSTSIILESALVDTNKSILVMCQKAESGEIKPWTIAKVTYEDGMYVHEGLGSFFESDGAKKYFFLAQGIEWNGGDTFDDLC